MANYEAKRWKRYGKDRLYIECDGVRVGWYDLLTDTLTVEQPGHENAMQTVVADWQSKNGEPVETATPSPPPTRLGREPGAAEPPPANAAEPTPEWVDLALNRPGQAAREQAKAEHDALKKKVTRLGAFVLKVIDEKTDERAWRVGAGGEETVGRLLEKLTGHGFRVLHAVPVGTRGSDIDHVLIGPPGVYTINTKTHPDGNIWVRGNTVKVNGHNQPYVRNSRFEAERAAQMLTSQLGWEPPVLGGIVFLTGTKVTRLTVKEPPEDVLIVGCSELPDWFLGHEKHLTAEQVDEVFQVARRSTTWQ